MFLSYKQTLNTVENFVCLMGFVEKHYLNFFT